MAREFTDASLIESSQTFDRVLEGFSSLHLHPTLTRQIPPLLKSHVENLISISLFRVNFGEMATLFLDSMPVLVELTISVVGQLVDFRLTDAPSLKTLRLEHLKDCKACVVQNCPALESFTHRLPQIKMIRLDELKADEALVRFDCFDRAMQVTDRVIVLTKELWLKRGFVLLKPRDGKHHATTLSLEGNDSIVEGIEFWDKHNKYQETLKTMVNELIMSNKTTSNQSHMERNCVVCREKNKNGGSIFKQCVQKDQLILSGRCGAESGKACSFDIKIKLPVSESEMYPYSQTELDVRQAKRKRDELRKGILGDNTESDYSQLDEMEKYIQAKHIATQADREFQTELAELELSEKERIAGLVDSLRQNTDAGVRDISNALEIEIFEANQSLVARTKGVRTYGPQGIVSGPPVPYANRTTRFKAGTIEGQFGVRGVQVPKAKITQDDDESADGMD